MDYEARHCDGDRCSRFIHKYRVQLKGREKCRIRTTFQRNRVELVQGHNKLSPARLII